MNESNSLKLVSVEAAGRLLGGISPWTLRKHIAVGNVKVTRIGRRVLLDSEEVDRIRRDGLPSLGKAQSEEGSRRSIPPEEFRKICKSLETEQESV